MGTAIKKYRVRGTGHFWDARGGPVVIQEVDRVVSTALGRSEAADRALADQAASIPELRQTILDLEIDMDWQGKPKVERIQE